MTVGDPGNESYQHLPERYLPTYFGSHNVEAVSRYDSATANDLKRKHDEDFFISEWRQK